MAVTKSLVAALFALFFISSALATADVPFLVVHKKASLNRQKSGAEHVSVSIDIYNQGSSTAYDVSLSDDSWPQDAFSVVSGNTSKSWERLEGGGLLSHSFELEAKSKGMFYSAPAVVTFRISTKAGLQTAFSTPVLPLDILAERTAEKKLDLAKRVFAKYGSQLSVVSIIALFVYLVASPSKSGGAKASKKKR